MPVLPVGPLNAHSHNALIGEELLVDGSLDALAASVLVRFAPVGFVPGHLFGLHRTSSSEVENVCQLVLSSWTEALKN